MTSRRSFFRCAAQSLLSETPPCGAQTPQTAAVARIRREHKAADSRTTQIYDAPAPARHTEYCGEDFCVR